MKLKLEDLTLKQIGTICANNDTCETCPLCKKEEHIDCCYYGPISPHHIHNQYKTEVEIPDNLLK